MTEDAADDLDPPPALPKVKDLEQSFRLLGVDKTKDSRNKKDSLKWNSSAAGVGGGGARGAEGEASGFHGGVLATPRSQATASASAASACTPLNLLAKGGPSQQRKRLYNQISQPPATPAIDFKEQKRDSWLE